MRVLAPEGIKDDVWRGVRGMANARAQHVEAHGGEIVFRYDWPGRARPSQLAPDRDWYIWLILTGRGWGKTRTGAEWVRAQVERQGRRRLALVADTAADVRDVMIEGESGILAVSPPWNSPLYEPSKRRLTWPNGAVATAYSAEDPEQLRGPQHDGAWVDELAKMHHQQEMFDNLMLGLRLGDAPQCVITTTPRATKLIKQLMGQDNVAVTRGHTYENLNNLAPQFRQQVIDRYEGTRLGRQELAGEILEDVEGALWVLARIDALRAKDGDVPLLSRVVVGVDPSGSADEEASEQGIVVAGAGMCACKGPGERHAFLLEDASGHYTPDGWGGRAVAVYRQHRADRIVGEANFGGDMVEAVIRNADRAVSYKAVSASRGKQLRAEPVAQLYERGMVHHVGVFPKLEDQLCNWVPGMRSPDRLDALVWTLTELMLGGSGPDLPVGYSDDDGERRVPSLQASPLPVPSRRRDDAALAGIRRKDF